MKSQQEQNPIGNTVEANVKKSEKPCQPACPVCGGSLIDITMQETLVAIP